MSAIVLGIFLDLRKAFDTVTGLEIRAWLFRALFALSHSFLRALLNFLGADILPCCLNCLGRFPNFWGQ